MQPFKNQQNWTLQTVSEAKGKKSYLNAVVQLIRLHYKSFRSLSLNLIAMIQKKKKLLLWDKSCSVYSSRVLFSQIKWLYILSMFSQRLLTVCQTHVKVTADPSVNSKGSNKRDLWWGQMGDGLMGGGIQSSWLTSNHQMGHNNNPEPYSRSLTANTKHYQWYCIDYPLCLWGWPESNNWPIKTLNKST